MFKSLLRLALVCTSVCVTGSMDGHAQWVQTSGPSEASLSAFATKNGMTIFAGSYNDGLFVSTDDGVTWSSTGNGLKDTMITSLAILGNDLFATNANGVNRSTDNGATWTPMNANLPVYMFTRNTSALFAVGSTLYVCPDEGIYASTDLGVSWTRLVPGPETPNDNVWQILGNGAYLLATTESGIFRSIDSGATWIQVDTCHVNHVSSMGSILFATTTTDRFILRSSDSGKTWVHVVPDVSMAITEMSVSGSDLFTVSYDGLYRSTDQGVHWIATRFPPILQNDTYGYGLISTSEALIIVTNGRGLFRTTDQGVSWSGVGPANTLIYSVASTSSVLFATLRSWNYAPDGLFTSSDDGLTWEAEGTSGIMTLAAMGRNVFGGSLWDGLHILAGSGAYDFLGWQGENIVRSSGTILVYVSPHYGVNFSSDSGQTWSLAPAGIYPDFGYDSLLIGTDSLNHVLRSTDLGNSWTNVLGLPDSPQYTMAMSGSVIVATNGTGMYRSTDGGTTWSDAHNGLPNAGLNVLAANVAGVVVATERGVFRSTNGGVSWGNWNIGLGTDTVTCLSINERYIFAGTQGQGVWRRPISDLSSVPPPIRMESVVLFPNPTAGTITIHNAPDDIERISIMNVLGKQVMDIPNVYGSDATLDLSNLSSGVYYARIVTQRSTTTKMIVRE
ncbi:MAG: T9SS type A sorting domain-containing protein [Bacteroidetes bacterium]|nr:T9SS type A sorting domain-containing protein [Bacteroidota bacterium]